MKNSEFNNLLLRNIILAILCGVLKAENITIPALFAFGDSILDTGNNNNLPTISKCNYPPYGRDFNGGIPTGRFSNGRIPTDLIASGLHIKDIVPAFLDPRLQNKDILTGVSFASGGSGLDISTSSKQSVIWVPDQIKLFKQYIKKLCGIVGEVKCKNIISNSLFVVSAGNNDIALTYFSLPPSRSLHYDVPAYSNMLTNWTSTFLEDLYNLGARKFIVFSTLPLGCLPSARLLTKGLLCNENMNVAAQTFNHHLSQKISDLNNVLSGASLMFFDVYTPLLNIIQNPAKFGFKIASGGCCCTVSALIPCTVDSEFIFWDYAHPTEKTYNIIVPMILESYRKQLS